LVATVCQPISPVSVIARDPVSEPTPTATIARTALASAIQPAERRISPTVGTSSDPANTNAATAERANATAENASVTTIAAGARTQNSARRERPVATRSRNTPLERSAVPASEPIRIALSAPKYTPSAATACPNPCAPPAGA